MALINHHLFKNELFYQSSKAGISLFNLKVEPEKLVSFL